MRIAAFAALVTLSATARVAAIPPDEVAFSLRPSGEVLLPVEIDGQGPFTFLLDTGSSHSLVASALAERLSLPVVAQARVFTPAGVQLSPVVRLERLSVGSASATDLMPSVVPHDELRRGELAVDGVIGQDFLSRFNYTVDYRRKRLRWSVEADERQVRLPLVRAGDRSLVELSGGRGRRAVLMVPDSGAQGLVLFERNGRMPLRVDESGQRWDVSDVAGARRVARGAVLRELAVGSVTLRDQPAVVVTREDPAGVAADGLLPLHTFSSVAFHNAEAYLVVRR